MQEYKQGGIRSGIASTTLVWAKKYRYQVLGGDVGHRCRELLREIAMSKEMLIYAGSINRDHAHMLIGIPSQLSVSRAVQCLKEKIAQVVIGVQGVTQRGTGVSIYGPGDIG
jgi:putative transposase